MIPYIDSSVAGFVIVTVCIAGGAAYLMGQALAATWRPVWQVVFYALLLGGGDRFLSFALFDGRFLSWSGYAIDTALLVFVGLVAYRITAVTMMVRQYPWLYARSTPFTWREVGKKDR